MKRSHLLGLVSPVIAFLMLLTACGQAAPSSSPAASTKSAQPSQSAASAPASSPASAAATTPIKIGISQPTSGQQGQYFQQQVVNPAILAVEEVNAQGGIRGRKLEYVVEDNKADAATAASVARKLLDVDKVSAIFISVTPATLATLPLAEEKKVMLLTIAEHPKVTESKWGARSGATGDKFGLVTARFAANQLKGKTAAILGEDNDAIRLQADAFKSEFEKLGGKVVAQETFKTEDQDFRAQLTKLREAKPDVLDMLATGSRPYGLALKQAAEMNFKPQFRLSSHQATDPEVRQIAGDLVDGLYYATFDYDHAFFDQKFKARFGYDADVNAAKSYDCVRVYLQALDKAGTDDPEKVRDTLYNFKDYQGALGKWGYAGTGEPEIFPVMKLIKNAQDTQANP